MRATDATQVTTVEDGKVRPFGGVEPRYNAEWPVEKNGYRSPADVRAARQAETFRRAA